MRRPRAGAPRYTDRSSRTFTMTAAHRFRNSARYWRTPLLPGADLLTAEYHDHEFAPHWHDAYTIPVIVAGAEATGIAARTTLPKRAACRSSTPASCTRARRRWRPAGGI